MQLRQFALVYDADCQQAGQLVRCTFRANVIDCDALLHQFVVTDAYESARVVVGNHFLTLDEGQEILSLALRPLEGPGRHLLTVAIDGERQAGVLVEIVP
jgi:hypothetical protein